MPCLFDILLYEFINASYKGMFDSVNDIELSPRILLLFFLPFVLYSLGKFYQPFCRIFSSVQHNVFNKMKKIRIYFSVNLQHSRINDSHIQTGFYSMKQKNGVNCFTNFVSAPE